MKRILAFALAPLFTVAVQAQQPSNTYYTYPPGDRSVSLDLQLSQHIGLNNWTGTGFIDNHLPRTSMTELRGVLNLPFSRPVGAFVDMGIGIMPSPRNSSLDIMDFPLPSSGSRYFLKEEISSDLIDNASANFKMTFGLFGRIRSGKLTVMPYAGLGFIVLPAPSYEAVIKEDGTNMQYRSEYRWAADEYSSSATLGYIAGRLNFAYPLSERTNLIFGLEYTHIYNRPMFSVQHINSFNENIVKRYEVEGNRMNMLGLSVGVSFR